jgi:thiol:disulfide interchange protein
MAWRLRAVARVSRPAFPALASVALALLVFPAALPSPAVAAASASSPGAAGVLGGDEQRFLPVEDAFRLSARALDDHTLEVRFDVADGYYLYRDKLAFAVEPGGRLAAPLPSGLRKHDRWFGDVETYRGQLVVRLALPAGRAGQSLVLKTDSQGCADAGLCYPPTVQQVRLTLPAQGAGPGPVTSPRNKGWFK